MADRFKLTISTLKSRCLPPDPGETTSLGNAVRLRFYWDSDVHGFGVIVRPSKPSGEDGKDHGPTKTFIVQRDINGRTRRVTIGQLGMMTVEEARVRARKAIVQMCDGVDPNRAKREKKARGVTLGEAMDWHLDAMRRKEASPRSTATLQGEVARLLGDWLPRPLAEITRNDCAARHGAITEANGSYVANRVMRHFRACFNTALRRLDDLPANPTRGVTFNRERRRREPIRWEELPAWRAAVAAIENPIRRDLQLFILLTGLRSTDARTVEWKHVDFERGTIHRPKPKGGVDRAFTVPLSAPVLEILRRRRTENATLYAADGGWAFPTRDLSGRLTHVSDPKEQRVAEDGRKVRVLPSPHRLRDTFATAAHEAGVSLMDMKVLMNHSLPSGGDVTLGYVRPSLEHLRAAAEQVAAFLLQRMAGECRSPGA